MKDRKISSREKYAELWKRIIAWIIDSAIILLTTWIFFLFVFQIEILFYFLFHLIAYLFGFFYFWLLESYNNGQTLGKIIFGLKTVNEETLRKASKGAYLKNCILKCHWLLCIIDVIIGAINNYGDPKNRLRIMQNVSQTVIIKVR